MSGGQARKIVRPFYGQTRAGGVNQYADATSYGVEIDQPNQGSNGGLVLVGGGGSGLLSQFGVLSGLGGQTTNLPILAMQLVQGTISGLTAGQQLPAPDFTAGIGVGTPTWSKISTSTIGLDWIGGLPAAPAGTIIGITNNSSGGQPINIWDVTVGGSNNFAFPMQALGFEETIFMIAKDSAGTFIQLFRSGSAYFQGGFNMGSRVVTVTTDSPTMIYQMPRAQGSGKLGGGFTCDVESTIVATGLDDGVWMGVRARWNSSHLLSIASTGVGSASGTPIVQDQDVVGTSTLTVDDNSTYQRLLFTRSPGVNMRVTVNNWHPIVGQT